MRLKAGSAPGHPLYASPESNGTPEKGGPLENSSQVSRALIGLRNMLLQGVFRPHHRISEIPLAARLGVSRTPLRLAFERLEQEGLVEALPGSGFAPQEFALNDVWDSIEMRGVLEGAAARLAAERLSSPAHLDRLFIVNHQLDQIHPRTLETCARYRELNDVFHNGILELAGSRVLSRAIERAYGLPFAPPSALILLHKDFLSAEALVPVAQEHHRSLLEAIASREGTRAESLAREHARLARRSLEMALQDDEVLKTVPGAYLIWFKRDRS